MGNISAKSKKEKKASSSHLIAPYSSTELIDLNADCLFLIFSYLEFPDLLNLRKQCSTLNYVVCKYLPHLTTLSVVLTEPRSKKPKLEYGGIESRSFEMEYYSKIQKHYKLEDHNIVTVRKQKKFLKLIEFIKKYEIHNVEALSVLMNDHSYISELPELLELCPKVRILFLDRLHRRELHSEPNLQLTIEDLDRLFASITSMSSLKDLHFFRRYRLDLESFGYYTSQARITAREKLDIFKAVMNEKLGKTINYSPTPYRPAGHVSGPAIAKIAIDNLEDDMEENIVQVSEMISNLRNMAVDMGSEITTPHNQIVDFVDKGESCRLRCSNVRARCLLR